MMRSLNIQLFVLIVFFTTACGQTGHLYLPVNHPNNPTDTTVLTTPLTPHPTNSLEMNQNAQTLTSPDTNANAYPIDALPR